MIKWFVKCDGKVTLSPHHITCLHNHPLADTTVAVLNSVDFQDTNLTFCPFRNSLSVPFRRGWSALFLAMKCTAKQSHKQRKSWKSTYVCSVFQFVGGWAQCIQCKPRPWRMDGRQKQFDWPSVVTDTYKGNVYILYWAILYIRVLYVYVSSTCRLAFFYGRTAWNDVGCLHWSALLSLYHVHTSYSTVHGVGSCNGVHNLLV